MGGQGQLVCDMLYYASLYNTDRYQWPSTPFLVSPGPPQVLLGTTRGKRQGGGALSEVQTHLDVCV